MTVAASEQTRQVPGLRYKIEISTFWQFSSKIYFDILGGISFTAHLVVSGRYAHSMHIMHIKCVQYKLEVDILTIKFSGFHFSALS